MAAPKEGGFKMSLGGSKTKLGFKASPAVKPAVKKSRTALLGEDEPDDSNEHTEISGWDVAGGGAVEVGAKKEEKPRVIPSLPNFSWKEEAQKKLLANAPHNQAQKVVEIKEEEPLKFGLTILKKEEPKEEEAEVPAEPMEDVKDGLTEEQRLEKKALDALVNGEPSDDRVIAIQTEEEAFRNGVRDAPEAPTLAAYEATPIEGFGAALLRGMGWKEDSAAGKNGAATKPKEVKRRPALLGIGAKASSAMDVELGAWAGGKAKGKKEAQSYNPVTLRNKVTGEVITEDELKAKLEQQELVDEKPKKEKERRKYSDDEDERRRERRRDRDRERRRDDEYESSSRRDRDRKDDRRRDKDDYYDSERRREKRKDKYRDEEYDSERRREKRRDRDDDYDRERRRDRRTDRSRSPDDERREKRRDRYRSRSRDSKRERDRRDRSRDDEERRKRRKER